MRAHAVSTFLVSLATLLAGCASSGGAAAPSGGFPAYGSVGVPVAFDGMGSYSRAVTTDSAEARRFFHQGLNWLYAFNHDESVVSFTRAAELDPGCAMAWWGIALAQGPNYNDSVMSPNRSAAAWAAIDRAAAELDDETELERAFVEALAARYAAEAPDDRSELDAAYVAAMGALCERFPEDPDAGTLLADAMMVQHPWKLYDADGEPAREATVDIVRALERVLAVHPDHPGANHLYIHAVEPSNDKARGVRAADALKDLVPASGHMLHMPSHIYVQVGKWDEAIEQSHKSMAADARYRELSPDQLIQHAYMSHNAHMLAFAAMMCGREEEAMAAARSMLANFPAPMLAAAGDFVDGTMCSVYDVHKRFGRWDALLAEPAPPANLELTNAIWHAHRAIAHAAKQDIPAARAEQRLFRDAMTSISIDGSVPFGARMKTLLVSEFFVEAEIELQRGEYESAAALLEQAAAIEDTIGYGEPPRWLQPVRHTLGVALMQAGDFARAEEVYREDLDRWPGNGWSLLGLSQALAAQGDDAAARVARAAFEDTWAGDVEEMGTSCRCVTELAGAGSGVD